MTQQAPWLALPKDRGLAIIMRRSKNKSVLVHNCRCRHPTETPAFLLREAGCRRELVTGVGVRPVAMACDASIDDGRW